MEQVFSLNYAEKMIMYEYLNRDASNLAERLKWKWSGHLTRMENNRWTHKLTMWDPREGKRNVGRQRTR